MPDVSADIAGFEAVARELTGDASFRLPDKHGQAVLIALFGLLARRTFEAVDARVVTWYVAAVRSTIPAIGDDDRLARLAEVVIRAQLGQHELVEPALGEAAEVVAIMTGLAADLLREPAVRGDQVAGLLSAAEAAVDDATRRASAKGVKDLADDVLRGLGQPWGRS